MRRIQPKDDADETDGRPALFDRSHRSGGHTRFRGPRRGWHHRPGGCRPDEGGAADCLERGIHSARDHDRVRRCGARVPVARRQSLRRELARPADPGPASDAGKVLRAVPAGRKCAAPRRPQAPDDPGAWARGAVAAACGRSSVAPGLRTWCRRTSLLTTSSDFKGTSVRKFVALAFIQLGFLAACGGGGYVVTTTPPPPSQNIAPPGPPNVETLTVDAGPAGAVNTAFVSVKVCVPGCTTSCKTIYHI